MSIRANPGVLLQHAWILFFSTSFFHSHSSYAHYCHTQIVADVLHVPRVEFLDYPSCERQGIMSKDELKYAICECPFDWGELQFTYCSGFAKGPRFLNMVMTFVFHPLSQSLVLDFCCPFLSILL